jgi:hypothetical protein
MNTTTKRAAISADIFGTTLTVNFATGQELAVDVTKLSPEIQRAAMLHGIKQKLIDSAAIARNIENGRSATVDDKYAAVKTVFDRITLPNGTWNKQKADVGEPSSGSNMLVRALMRMTGKDKVYVEDFLAAKTKEQRSALKKNPKVLAIIADLRSAEGTGDVDTNELLGELGVEAAVVEVAPEPDEMEQAALTLTPDNSAVAPKPKRARKPKAAKSE